MERVKFDMKSGILYGPYPDGIELDLEFVQQIVVDRLEFLNGKVVPGIVDTSGVKSATKDARDYFAKPESSKGLSAIAILSKSMLSTFLCNFFIKVSLIKAPIPVKQFTDEKEALIWLEKFK
jgi:hypothetical protein